MKLKRMEKKFNNHIRYDVLYDILTDKAQLHSKTRRCAICGGQNDNRTGLFPSISVLPCHYHSIHILTLHTHLFIVSLYNLINRQCCLFITLLKDLDTTQTIGLVAVIYRRVWLLRFQFYFWKNITGLPYCKLRNFYLNY